MRILISAYACEPGRGSEPEVGLRTVLAAATRHEVWVITRANNVAAVEAAVAEAAPAGAVHVVGLDLGGRWPAVKRWGRPGLYLYYDRWQRAAARTARALDREIGFDVVHHATFATYWARAGAAWLDRPLVWGPVGGGVTTPRPLWTELGPAGAAADLARLAATRALARLPAARRAPERAAIAIAQNPATARLLRAAGEVDVLPNATAVDVPAVPAAPRTRDIVVAGTLIPLKGTRLAVRALRHVADPAVTLTIYGEGPERGRLERAVRRWGLADRVSFAGRVPRPELLAHVARAGALVHPALHDEAGLAVAEALALGTPVVCLDHGGPAEVVRNYPVSPAVLVPVDRPASVARAIAAAIDGFLASPPQPPAAPLPPRRPYGAALLAAYERAAG